MPSIAISLALPVDGRGVLSAHKPGDVVQLLAGQPNASIESKACGLDELVEVLHLAGGDDQTSHST